jgi:hypothetical protein
MADVFISYSSKDRESAEQLARALAALGRSVWWDREILTGQAFDRAIEQELEGARSVIVLWSRNSVDSEWVKNEAAAAAERGVLLPANIDGTKLPLEFRRKQTADLTGWAGDPSHEGFQALRRAIDSIVGADAGPKPLALGTAPQRDRRLALAAISAVAVALAGAYLGLSGKKVAPTQAALDTTGSGAVQSERPATAAASTGLADAVVGTYVGDVISDSRGSSRSNIVVTLTGLGPNAVRATSAYGRIGTIDVELTRIEDKILNAAGDTPLIVDLAAAPATLSLDPHGELAYRGTLKR